MIKKKKKLPPFLAKVSGGNATKRADRRAYRRGGVVSSKADLDPISPTEPNAPAGGKVLQKFQDGGVLSAAQRQSMPKSDFALPGKGKGPKGAGAGSYPIPDASHARNALARVSQHGSSEEKSAVRAKVHAKYPGIGQK
jgi:hypothetical protein